MRRKHAAGLENDIGLLVLISKPTLGTLIVTTKTAIICIKLMQVLTSANIISCDGPQIKSVLASRSCLDVVIRVVQHCK